MRLGHCLLTVKREPPPRSDVTQITPDPAQATRATRPRRRAAAACSARVRLRLLALRPHRRARRPGLVRDLRDRHRLRTRRSARPDARRVVAAGSRPRRRLALPDPAGSALPVRRRRATPGRSPRRSASTATRSRRRSTRSSGGTSPASAPRATRSSSSSTSRAPACRGCSAPGTRRSTTRPLDGRPAKSSAGRPADGTGPFTFVESVSGSHLDVARWEGYRGPRTTWEENAGPAYLDGIRWIPILDDRERAAALERGEIDCLQNASLLDVDRLAANPDLEVIEFQQSALVYLGLDHQDASAGTSASGARSRRRSTGRRSSTGT